MQNIQLDTEEHVELLEQTVQAPTLVTHKGVTFVWPSHLGQVHVKSDVKSDV